MAETLPHIQVTHSQFDATRPLGASPGNDSTFTDALEYQLPPTRHPSSSADAVSQTRSAAVSADDGTEFRIPQRDQVKVNPINKERPVSQASFDPVAQAIYDRTGNVPSVATTQKGHRQSESWSQALSNIANDFQDTRLSTDTVRGDLSRSTNRDRRKGVALLAHRIIGRKKKDEQDETMLDSSETSEDRPEGADVEMFYQSLDNMGYTPKHRLPPPYIKMRSKYKREREFNRMFLAQSLRDYSTTYQADQAFIAATRVSSKDQRTESKSVWAIEVSKDGKYLASAGQDRLVRVWSILSSPQDRTQFSKDETVHMLEGQAHLSAPVFKDQPLHHFTGHTNDILSLSWSKNNFLLSSSMDKTVRLWHVSQRECLCVFKHSDFVPSVAFHPRDDRFFLSGSLDCKLRLWSIPDKTVASFNQAPDMITSVAFTPDGKQAIAGTLSGFCLFYETESMRFQTQIHVKSRTGKNAKGSKITGIKTMHIGPAGINQSSGSLNSLLDVKILIASNDSRLRLYNLRDKSLEMKFKGHENLSSQIHARFSDDGRYVISGSEDKRVYIWSTSATDTAELSNSRKDHWPVEIFEPHSANSNCALFLPARSRQHLSASEDPIYDICNPPPITLVSRSEAADVPFTSVRHSMSIDNPGATDSAPIVRPSLDSSRRASEANSTYLSRTVHANGNIVISASADGKISVFRQDCGWRNRARSNADPSAFTHPSDTSSIKRVSTSIINRSSLSASRPGRSPTSLSRQDSTASARSSIGGRSSLRNSSYGSTPSTNFSSNAGRDRAMNWRTSISGTSIHSVDRELPTKGSPALSLTSSTTSSPILPQMRAGNRSTSPRKPFGFTKRASALVPGSRSPTRDAVPATAGAHGQLDGSSEASPLRGRYSLTPTRSGQEQQGIPDLRRGSSYWRQEAWHDEMREQLQVPHRSLANSSTNDSSRSPSRSPDPNKRAFRANGAASPSNTTSAEASRRSSKLLEPGAFHGLEKELSGFSALSDNESNAEKSG